MGHQRVVIGGRLPRQRWWQALRRPLAVFVVRRLERSADWTRSVWMLVAFVSVFPLAMFNAGIWVALHAVM